MNAMNLVVSNAVSAVVPSFVSSAVTSATDSKQATVATNRRTKLTRRIFSVLLVVLCMSMLMVVPMFANDGGGSDLQSGITEGMKQVWILLRGISYGVAVVFVAVAAFKLIMGGQKGMEVAKADLIRAIIFAAIIVLAPVILTTIYNWFIGSGSEGDFDTPQFG